MREMNHQRAQRQIELQKKYYPESKFGGFTNVDGTIAFYSRVNSLVNPSSVVLDVGCGKGAYELDPIKLRQELRIFKGKCRKVIGIDTDKDAQDNPFLDEFRLLKDEHWPVENKSVDVCVVDSVLEHVSNPELFFRECARVLKHGGYVCIRTPNILSYFGLMSMLIPNRFHSKVVNKVQSKHFTVDVFPTVYKSNTKWKIRKMLKKNGFDCSVCGYEAEPQYLAFSHLLYWLGVLHQKFTPDIFKLAIFAFGKKES